MYSKTMTDMGKAIERSSSHNEVVAVEFAGDYGQLLAWLNGNITSEYYISEENDGKYGIDSPDEPNPWLLLVTLVSE